MEAAPLTNTICIYGLGYVGLTLGISFANAGFRVVGIEVNRNILDALNADRAHFYEPKLNEMILANKKSDRFLYSERYDKSEECNVHIITIGTPLDQQGHVNLSMIKRVIDSLSEYIKPTDLLILRSTVMVGTTRKIAESLKEKVGFSPKVAFCPERTIEGSAMEEIRELPQVIGGIDKESARLAREIFSNLTKTVVVLSSPEAAEMVKLVDNVSRDTTFALSNEIALACDHLSLSAHEILTAGSRGYSRTKLPMPGPVGGPCLEKDTYIYAQSMSRFQPSIALEARAVNESILDHALNFLQKKFDEFPSRIGILGLAFKGNPPTNDLRGSVAINLVRKIQSMHAETSICGYDPFVGEGELELTNLVLKKMATVREVIENSELIFIMNKNYEFENFNFEPYLTNGVTIYDFWSQSIDFNNNYPNYICFGSHIGMAK